MGASSAYEDISLLFGHSSQLAFLLLHPFITCGKPYRPAARAGLFTTRPFYSLMYYMYTATPAPMSARAAKTDTPR